MSGLSLMLQLLTFTAVALGLVYFLFYRPTVGAQNRQRRVIAGLRVGDEVVTTSGFIATVVDIREPDDGPVELLLDLGGVTVRARTHAIADRLPRPEEHGDVESPSRHEQPEAMKQESVAG
jgi:preprotein translocase YajC subunit